MLGSSGILQAQVEVFFFFFVVVGDVGFVFFFFLPLGRSGSSVFI